MCPGPVPWQRWSGPTLFCAIVCWTWEREFVGVSMEVGNKGCSTAHLFEGLNPMLAIMPHLRSWDTILSCVACRQTWPGGLLIDYLSMSFELYDLDNFYMYTILPSYAMLLFEAPVSLLCSPLVAPLYVHFGSVVTQEVMFRSPTLHSSFRPTVLFPTNETLNNILLYVTQPSQLRLYNFILESQSQHLLVFVKYSFSLRKLFPLSNATNYPPKLSSLLVSILFLSRLMCADFQPFAPQSLYYPFRIVLHRTAVGTVRNRPNFVCRIVVYWSS